ncbi:MAG: hypothetical protein PVJ57_14200 [Phycisphaerae bacterium]
MLIAPFLGVACMLTAAYWPAGVLAEDLELFWLYSEVTESVSPGGEVVRHVLNNAGAAHVGLHYVWVLHKRHWWERWRVVAAGWSHCGDAQTFITWTDARTFEIRLNDSRKQDRWRVRRVTVR